jgi:hypothetical protein
MTSGKYWKNFWFCMIYIEKNLCCQYFWLEIVDISIFVDFSHFLGRIFMKLGPIKAELNEVFRSIINTYTQLFQILLSSSSKRLFTI